jgi:hypothetical protein
MTGIIQQGPQPSDPIEELRDAVDYMRDELSTLAEKIRTDNEWIKGALKETLRELQSKSDRDD